MGSVGVVLAMVDEELQRLWPLDYWQSKEWLDVQDHLDGMDQGAVPYNPARGSLFRSLELCPLDLCNVAIVLQDPYPNPLHSTGVALSCQRPDELGLDAEGRAVLVPDKRLSAYPASLNVFFKEYRGDLGYSQPSSGCLEAWCEQGVLLWNATPTIGRAFLNNKWETVSHRDWPEWPPLTQEIIERLSAKGGVVFAFVGARAREYAQFVDQGHGYNTTLFFTHPSPRAQNNRVTFTGSRFFTTINHHLATTHLKQPIDWRLE